MSNIHITSATVGDNGSTIITYTFTANGVTTDLSTAYGAEQSDDDIKSDLEAQYTTHTSNPMTCLAGQQFDGSSWSLDPQVEAAVTAKQARNLLSA